GAQLDRTDIVVCEQLRVVLDAPQRGDPGSGVKMLLRAWPARDLTVGDVAEQSVLERVLGFAGYRRDLDSLDVVLAFERLQVRFRLPAERCALLHERPQPEHLADYGGFLQQALLFHRQHVETGGDDAL